MTDQEKAEFYGADAAEWLKRWDDGRSVWSIEMGGLGPGYEQCIQITAAEVIRYLLDSKVEIPEQDKKSELRAISDDINKSLFANPKIDALGLSGAQAGAAKNLAVMLYKRGPIDVMADEQMKDRRIQVSRRFPEAA